MATALVRYSAAAITDRGRKRASNEDAFGYSVEHGVYVVCDGMGGAAAGEIASSLAVDEVLRLVTERVTELTSERASKAIDNGNGFHADPDRLRGAESSSIAGAPALQSLQGPGAKTESLTLPTIAEEAVVAANEAVHSRAQRNLRLNGMGTTMVGLLAGLPDEEGSGFPSRVWILNVGDSRCYRLRQQRLHLCTQDHSLVEEQVRMGRMTRAEAARSPLRNVITRAVGTQGNVTADLIETEVAPGDLFLLCSDGLTRELSDEKIEMLLNSPVSGPAPLDELCARLVQAANKAGGHDNITCLLVRVE